MDKAEFDKFAREYRAMHADVTRSSGEEPEFFAEYKVKDVVRLVREMGFPADLRLLDFGAGIGSSLPFFRKLLPAARITCLDISSKSLEIAAERFPEQAEFVTFDGARIPSQDETFDLIFTACVFHHIEHREHPSLYAEIRRVLKPGGVFVNFEHNPSNPLTVRVVQACALDENAVLIDPSDMRSSLCAAGFEDVEVIYRLFFPGWLRVLRPMERFLTRLPIGAQYYAVAKKPA
jgi:ubiquinone/menaquinone biosynthesis C-methylase UbiE